MQNAYFAPQLYINSGITDISFYERAFDAIEQMKITNDDGTIHVVELSIGGAIFHIHEETENPKKFSAERHKGTTVLIGLFVADVDSVVAKAIEAGATLLSPAESYDYGYRQAEILDPFGHVWQIESKL